MLTGPTGSYRAAFLVGVVATALTAGCSGRMTCHFVTLNMKSIAVEPTDAKVTPMECTTCTWWVDDQGRLNVAGWFQNASLLDKRLDRTFYLSFVLGRPSKGVGKNYIANLSTARAYIKTPLNVYGLKSSYGIVGIEHRNGDTLVGAFRINARLYARRFLGGWTTGSPYLLFGTFQAVKDTGQGRTIREATEADTFERNVRKIK